MNRSYIFSYKVHLLLIILFAALSFFDAAQNKIQVSTSSVPSRLVITNVNIVDVASGQILNGMDIFVEGTLIKNIHPHKAGSLSKGRSTLVIPADGKYIVPGLVDAHTHIVFESELIHYLANGVTTVFSLGGPIYMHQQ
jgi:adenine deaminase